MATLFFLVPALLAMIVDPLDRAALFLEAVGLVALVEMQRPARLLMPALLLFTALVTVWLLRDRTFDRRRMWGWPATRRALPTLGVIIAAAMLVTLAVASLLHWHTGVLVTQRPWGPQSQFFRLPRDHPIATVVILMAYPWFSAYPQEITHRAFFFHRYAAVLPGRWAMICVNAVAFAWLHVPFLHWMALAVTLPGGVMFAWIYDRTRSTLACTIAHGVMGWWAFVVGLGWFVFTGSITAGQSP